MIQRVLAPRLLTFVWRKACLISSKSVFSIIEVKMAPVPVATTIGSPSRRPKVSTTMGNKSDIELFDSVFPQILSTLTERNIPGINICMEWFQKVLEYNVPHGKKNRGMATLQTYKLLVENPTEEGLRQACYLGWCTEILQAYFLVADDIMDQSETRRGRKCWYKNDQVGLIALNDALFLENCIFQLLKKFFKGSPCYVDIFELLHEADFVTIHGQCLDMLSSCEGKSQDVPCDLSVYTEERYAAIVANKTAFYSFYLPVALALHLAGVSDEATLATAKEILMEMGHFFQVQDDYLDCYGDPAVTGKIGTDIQDGKCSWLVIQALAHASVEQRNIIQENYGKQDMGAVARVKEVYAALDVAAAYHRYEDASFRRIHTLIDAYQDDSRLPRQVFHGFASKIYKRDK